MYNVRRVKQTFCFLVDSVYEGGRNFILVVSENISGIRSYVIAKVIIIDDLAY